MLLRVLFPKLTSRHNVSFGYNILIIRRYIIFFRLSVSRSRGFAGI